MMTTSGTSTLLLHLANKMLKRTNDNLQAQLASLKSKDELCKKENAYICTSMSQTIQVRNIPHLI